MKPSDLTKKSIVTIKDDLTIKDCIAAGKGIKGLNMSIVEERIVREKSNLCAWFLYFLVAGPEADAYRACLCLKQVGDTVSVRLYEAPEWFPKGNRKSLEENGVAPEILSINPEQTLAETDFKESISLNVGEVDAVFVRKMPTIYGEVSEAQGEKYFCGVTEYVTDAEAAANKEILILETGGLDSEGQVIPEGGYVELFNGRDINPATDIDVV